MIVDLETAFKNMRAKGYCLWIGAGASIHVARAGAKSAPDWGTLASVLEHAAGLPRVDGKTLPARLDAVRSHLGREPFQRELRTRIYDPVAEGVLVAARRSVDACPQSPIPEVARELAGLGALANPIVNFNIETLTSVLLSGGGHFETKPFLPNARWDDSPAVRGPQTGPWAPQFKRAIYHPHGDLLHVGPCVMCASDYEAMNGTLALQLAVHAAFRATLVIVGMSLDDDYLRKQIVTFRPWIDQVLWFRGGDASDPRTDQWATLHNVDMVPVGSWPSFWREVPEKLPAPDELSIANNWWRVIAAAAEGLAQHSVTRPDRYGNLGLPEPVLEKLRERERRTGFSEAASQEVERRAGFESEAEKLRKELMVYVATLLTPGARS